ncbi:MAG: carboxypeptidase regulatory-like domain-containing protein [Myxococcales bacterium]|nr:carboxypeptidase regulatory-like domain-containing protein [Myxococcales bacterium]
MNIAPRITSAALTGLMALVGACTSSGGGSSTPFDFSGARVITPRAARVDLFDPAPNGSVATGRVGDVALANDRVKLVIQAPDRDEGLGPYGGTIVDADLKAAAGGRGIDQFGELTPTFGFLMAARATRLDVVEDGGTAAPSVVTARGVGDIFDFLDPFGVLYTALRGLGPFQDLLFGLIENGIGDREGFGLFFPDLTRPVETETRYTLAPGDRYVTVTTTLTNRGADRFVTPTGDMIDPRGDLEMFIPATVAPSQGFGEQFIAGVDWLGFQGNGVSYGYLPDRDAATGEVDTFFIAIGGAFLLISGSSDLGEFAFPDLNATPYLSLEPGASGSWTRRFIIGDGSISSISDVVYALQGIPTGTVEGIVRESGTGAPLAGVRVTALRDDGAGADLSLPVTQFVTDAEGRYRGDLPAGAYGLIAAAGSNFGEDTRPSLLAPAPIAVTVGGTTVRDLALGQTGTLRVEVVDLTDGGAAPLPARVSVIGLDPTPRTTALMDITEDGGPTALAHVYFLAGAPETVEIEPGEYEIVVTAGPEYDDVRRRVTIAPGANGTLRAELTRVVDTRGWLAAEFHVHQLPSFDSQVRPDARVVNLAADGVELVVPTDHDVVTDLAPVIARLGLGARMTSAVGLEATTAAYGHYNAWPLTVDPASRSGGALIHSSQRDIPVPIPDGDPSLPGDRDGATPSQLFEAIDALYPGPQVRMVNHPRDGILGYFDVTRIDFSKFGTPELTPIDPTAVRLAPGARLYVPGSFNAMEIQNGTSLGDFSEVLNDWFALLHLGERVAGTGVSDTHVEVEKSGGFARTYVPVANDDPGAINHLDAAGRRAFEDAMVGAVVGQRIAGSLGLFVTATLTDDDPSPSTDAVGMGGILSTTAPGGAPDRTATLRVHVESPTWIEYDRIEVFVGTPARANPLGDLDPASPADLGPEISLDLDAPGGFTRALVPVGASARYQTDVAVPLSVARDTWVVVVARGTPGRSRTLFPAVAASAFTITEATTLDDLLVDEVPGGVYAHGFTNPIYLDIDGDGVSTPEGVGAIRPALAPRSLVDEGEAREAAFLSSPRAARAEAILRMMARPR